MANRAYFYVGTKDGPPQMGDEQVLGANYLVPVLWLACLNNGALKHAVLNAEDEDEVYYFSERADEALKRCENRSASLRKCISNIDDYLPAWLDLLRSLKRKYIKIDPSEVIWMTEAAKSELESSLVFLDAPTKDSALGFFKTTSLSDVYIADSHEVYNSPGKMISEVMGKESDEFTELFESKDRRLPDYQARDYVTGYKIASWIPWEPSSGQEAASPVKRSNLTTVQRLSWHPLPPLGLLLFFLYRIWPPKFTLFTGIGFVVLVTWFSLSVYDHHSKGKFTSWLYSDE